MSIRYSFAVLLALLISQPVFADEAAAKEKPCTTIVKACLDAGYTQGDTEGKQFWKDCMKPLVLGQAVSGITVDAKEVKTCRAAKIKELKQELTELKNAK
jgi:hypothetical protein